MSYIKPSTRKVNRQKPPLVETVSNKRYLVILTKQGKIASDEGRLLIFYRRKDAEWWEDYKSNRPGLPPEPKRKIEKLDILITR